MIRQGYGKHMQLSLKLLESWSKFLREMCERFSNFLVIEALWIYMQENMHETQDSHLDSD